MTMQLDKARLDEIEADRYRLIHILVVHYHMFRAKAEEAADLFLHDKTLSAAKVSSLRSTEGKEGEPNVHTKCDGQLCYYHGCQNLDGCAALTRLPE